MGVPLATEEFIKRHKADLQALDSEKSLAICKFSIKYLAVSGKYRIFE